MKTFSKAKDAGKTRAIIPAIILGLTAFVTQPAGAQERDRLDDLVLCSAIFNASVERTTGEELRNEYIQETVSYAEAAIALADARGMGEKEFQTYAVNLGDSFSIAESELPAERARCRSDVTVTRQ